MFAYNDEEKSFSCSVFVPVRFVRTGAEQS
jgi:hypothetical protein